MTSDFVIPSLVRRRIILPRPLIVAESHKDNAIESGIGLSVASAVESVAFGLA